MEADMLSDSDSEADAESEGLGSSQQQLGSMAISLPISKISEYHS
jgi:hypothetical protein